MQTPCCSRHFSKQMRGDAFSVSQKCHLGNINVRLAVGCNTSWQWWLISGNVSHRSGWNLRVFLGTRLKTVVCAHLPLSPGLDWQVLGHSFPTETEKQPISMKLEDREKIPTGSTARESVKNRKTPAKIGRDGTYDSCWDIWVRTTLLGWLTPPLHGLKSEDIYDSGGILDSLTEGVFKGEGVFGKS